MFLKEFVYMPRADRRRIVAILITLVLIGVAIYVLNFVGLNSNPVDEAEKKTEAKRAERNTNGKTYTYATQHKAIELFYFDPNTADSTQLLKLGLQPWQVRNIYKYRAKGGIYRSKEDFAYVYGLTVKDYRRLAPYIRISEDYLPASSLAEVRRNNRYDGYRQPKYGINGNTEGQVKGEQSVTQSYTPKIHAGEFVSVNVSDTTALKTIPGIGSYYARRIVRYRDQLGGFVEKEQLTEIEDFPEEAISYISIDKSKIKKLKINQLTLSQLRKHPYINYYQARAITDYRRLHGAIRNIQELRLMKEFSSSDLKRIEPYIEY